MSSHGGGGGRAGVGGGEGRETEREVSGEKSALAFLLIRTQIPS